MVPTRRIHSADCGIIIIPDRFHRSNRVSSCWRLPTRPLLLFSFFSALLWPSSSIRPVIRKCLLICSACIPTLLEPQSVPFYRPSNQSLQTRVSPASCLYVTALQLSIGHLITILSFRELGFSTASLDCRTCPPSPTRAAVLVWKLKVSVCLA